VEQTKQIHKRKDQEKKLIETPEIRPALTTEKLRKLKKPSPNYYGEARPKQSRQTLPNAETGQTARTKKTIVERTD